jgi:peptide/nickel transport system substrate-binding protein
MMDSPSSRLSRRELLERSALLAGLGVGGANGGLRAGSALAQDATPPAAGVPGGKAVWALDFDPINLVPYLAPATVQMQGKEFLYDSLLAWDRDLNVVPALAESYTTPDNLTYVFKLRQGVKFHNGKEMDADDVKYSIDLFMTPPAPNAKNTNVLIQSTEVVDKYTVKVTTSSPDPTIPGYLAWGRQTGIIPKGANESMDLTTQAIGTGPYKLVEFVPGDRVVLTRNPDFWRAGLPYIDDLTLKVLADEQLRLAAIRSGDVDGCTLPRDLAQSLANNDSLTILSGPTAAPRVIQFKIKGQTDPWHDVRVRQAINAVVDRQDIIDKVYGGDAVMTGPIPPGYGDWFITPDELASTYYKTDLDKAKQLMADAGVSGFKVELQAISDPRDYTQIAEIIQQQVKQIGIEVTVQPLEIGTFAANVGSANFEWASTGRGMRGDPSGFVNDFRPQTSAGFDPSSMFDKTGWYSAELADLYDKALQTTDPAARKPMYRRIQEIILTEVPNMYTVQPKKFQVTRSRLKNMYVSFTDFNSGLREAWVED